MKTLTHTMTFLSNAVTYREAARAAEAYLSQKGIEEAAADAAILMEFVTGMDRTHLLLEAASAMTAADRALYEDAIRRRGERTPLQHITGEQEFMGLSFRVTKDVLVPRQDTEILAEEALSQIRRMQAVRVLDLCTGSGCLAISIQLLAKQVNMTASDLSLPALAVAKENADRLGAKVEFVHSDLFENLRGPYDLIVSNPPYIATKEIETLAPEVRESDPMSALDGGEDGLMFYRAITEKAPKYLKRGGMILFEIGADQAEAVSSLLAQASFTHIFVRKDLAGLDRVVGGTYEL